MTIPMGPKSPLMRWLARAVARAMRFHADKRGSVAVEFGLVAIPFLALLFAIFQTALVVFTGQVLDSALQDAARLIMTGQAQSMTASAFATSVCGRIPALFNCTNAYTNGSLQFDIRAPSSFANAVLTPPTVSGNTINWARRTAPRCIQTRAQPDRDRAGRIAPAALFVLPGEFHGQQHGFAAEDGRQQQRPPDHVDSRLHERALRARTLMNRTPSV